MNIYFFGYAITKDEEGSNEALSPIGNNMQLGLLKEWKKKLNKKLRTYTFYPISPYHRSKILILKGGSIDVGDGLITKLLPFVNITIIKQICIMLATTYYLIKDLNRDKGNHNLVFTYHVSFFFSIPVLALSKLYKYKTVCLISDAPIDSNKRKNLLIDILRKCSNALRIKLIGKYDGYITINEFVLKELKIKKPFIPIYVGADNIEEIKLNNIRGNKRKTKIVYTGALEEYYNIDKMFNAMKYLGADYELHLYGKGTLVEMLDFDKVSNVKYHGFVSNQEIRKIQIDADILVCLLSKDSYLGKYAFPGKLFEYLLSGTPIVSCKTPSISKELMPYLNFVDGETEQEIANCILKIAHKEEDYKTALLLAEEGRQFIINNCTWKSQVQRIHEFSEKLINDN